MNDITNLIKSEIKRQYKTVMNFAKASGIPYSTLSNALSKGVSGTSFGTVMKICNMLDIRQPCDDEKSLCSDLALLSRDYCDICSMLTALDDRGLHTVNAILNVEYNRCLAQNEGLDVKPFSRPEPAKSRT